MGNIAFVLFSVDADSWQGGRNFHSVHATLDSALAHVPDWAKKYEREPYRESMVANFAYYEVEKVPLHG